jgi:hypothetical protein
MKDVQSGDESMAKTGMNDDQLIEEFDDEGGLGYDEPGEELDFAPEDDLLGEDVEDDEEVGPSVLYKGVSRPKTDEDWRHLLMEASREGVPDYRITDAYHDGALVIHPVFGFGVVSKVISSKKMEVIFDTTKKLMAMNVMPPQS